jgi:uncharacterized membrane protein
MSYSLEILFNPRYYVLHIAIALIAIALLSTLFYEMKKPKRDPNENEDTKRMNDILKED